MGVDSMNRTHLAKHKRAASVIGCSCIVRPCFSSFSLAITGYMGAGRSKVEGWHLVRVFSLVETPCGVV